MAYGSKKNDPYDTEEERQAWITGQTPSIRNQLWGDVSAWESGVSQYNKALGNLKKQATGAQSSLAGLDYTHSLGGLENYGRASQSRLDTLAGLEKPSGAKPSTRKTVDTPWGTKHTFDFSKNWKSMGLSGDAHFIYET